MDSADRARSCDFVYVAGARGRSSTADPSNTSANVRVVVVVMIHCHGCVSVCTGWDMSMDSDAGVNKDRMEYR